jgi:hypothetical protein
VTLTPPGIRPDFRFRESPPGVSVQIAVSYRSFKYLSNKENQCEEDLGNVTYIIDWITGETVNYEATQEDCEIQLS